MTIAELEKKSGFQRSTIHHYIRCGLLHDPYRTSQTMAYYDESHLEMLREIKTIKVNFLKTAKTSRVPLDFIKSQMEEIDLPLPESVSPTRRTQEMTSAKKKKKREEIMEAALELYSKHGYYRTSIRDITKKVHISAPTFYHYYSDKRELLMEVIEYVIADWKEASKAALQAETNSARRSLILFRVFQNHYPRVGEVLNHLRAGVVIGDAWARKKLLQVYKDLMANLVELIKTSMEKGDLREMDPELLSYFFFVIDEAAVQRAELDDKYTMPEILSFVANMIALGLMSEKGKKKWLKDVRREE